MDYNYQYFASVDGYSALTYHINQTAKTANALLQVPYVIYQTHFRSPNYGTELGKFL